MGALVTRALRPLRSFNIANRAERIISKEKPTAAPKYPSNLQDYERALELDPNLDEKLDKKNITLDKRLRDVYVTSKGKPEDDITRAKQDQYRPLPHDRHVTADFEYGVKEPDLPKQGNTTIRNVMNFLSAHQVNPKEVSAAKIAAEQNMKEDDVKDIMKYFKTFEIYVPATKTSSAQFAGPSQVREMAEEPKKQIDAQKDLTKIETKVKS